MGAEVQCDATVNGRAVHGKAKLETATLEFRAADLRLVLPFKELENVHASNGILSVSATGRKIALTIGAAAPKWADRILRPPSRLQKIGAKAAWRVAIFGSADAEFIGELTPAVASVSSGRAVRAADAIFFFLKEASDLGRIAVLKRSLASDGALWIVRPKGHAEITERAVMQAGKNAGLVDVKVVGFSPTHTAEKFVIPVSQRPT